MNLRGLWKLLTNPRRAARSRGHGVHSPFAYRFVREVLRQPYAYYIYPELDEAARSEGRDPRVVRAMYRTALFFAPTPVEVQSAHSDAVEMALKAGNSHLCNPKETARCIIATDNAIDGVIRYWEQADSGMLFHTPEAAFFVKSKLLPHQRFDILLP